MRKIITFLFCIPISLLMGCNINLVPTASEITYYMLEPSVKKQKSTVPKDFCSVTAYVSDPKVIFPFNGSRIYEKMENGEVEELSHSRWVANFNALISQYLRRVYEFENVESGHSNILSEGSGLSADISFEVNSLLAYVLEVDGAMYAHASATLIAENSEDQTKTIPLVARVPIDDDSEEEAVLGIQKAIHQLSMQIVDLIHQTRCPISSGNANP